ncbi:hypothetical protein [Tsukamurella sp. 1534]|uniref:hypothetical protein n=1 Tax=Tsukamurella sp. 1534 TaxID=1151061 RepID=UPI0002E36EDE|nr:hypothetical protein [Tsukamurella sp. 1534]
MTEYTIADMHDARLLLAGPDHWLVVDLVPDQPIRMSRYDDEAAARGAFTTN